MAMNEKSRKDALDTLLFIPFICPLCVSVDHFMMEKVFAKKTIFLRTFLFLYMCSILIQLIILSLLLYFSYHFFQVLKEGCRVTMW